MVGIVGTFILLGRNNAKLVYPWMALQTLCLLFRMVVYYFGKIAEGTRQSLRVGRPRETDSPELKQSTVELLMTLAR
jgi:hypothetical protein